MKKIQSLDCTLRDGGYYTNWNFDDNFVQNYIAAIKKTDIDYIEIGYLSHDLNDQFGLFYNLDKDTVKFFSKAKKKIAVMINAKEWYDNIIILKKRLNSLSNIVNLVRITVDIKSLNQYSELLYQINKFPIPCAINLMYSHKFLNFLDYEKDLSYLCNFNFEYLNIVDSYGCLEPKQVSLIFNQIKKISNKKILGFHGHNNLQLALANSITALENGAKIIDHTFTGIGRGAGNLQTELFLSYKRSINFHNISFIDKICTLTKNLVETKHQWGTSIPYMLSGIYKQPQKQIMDLILLNRYDPTSFLENFQKGKIIIPKFELQKIENSKFIVIGGGKNIISIEKVINSNYFKKEHSIFFLGIKNYKPINKKHFVILSYKDFNINNIKLLNTHASIITDRKYINKSITKCRIYNIFDEKFLYSPLSIFFLALNKKRNSKIYFLFLDGYKQSNLHKENKEILEYFRLKQKYDYRFLTKNSYFESQKNQMNIFELINS